MLLPEEEEPPYLLPELWPPLDCWPEEEPELSLLDLP
jgi:hypothetical protein